MGKDIDKKILKPLLKKVVSKQVDMSHISSLFLEENLDFETFFNEI